MNKILNNGNVVRYCSPQHFTNGKLQASAFNINNNKPLSVNWIEFFKCKNIELVIQEIRNEFHKINFDLKENGRFVKINILSAKNYVQNKTGVSIIFKKNPRKNQPSHCEILGYEPSNKKMAKKIAVELFYIARKENCFFPGIDKTYS